MESLIFDTTFLIDFQRERKRSNDLWIAASALDCGFPLVTANAVHFVRVPELRLLGY